MRNTLHCLAIMSRPVIGAIAALAACAALWLAQPSATFGVFTLVVVVLVTITSAGFVINDYFDIEKDKINEPQRPLPSGRLKPETAYCSALVLFAAGNIAAAFLPSSAFALALFNSLLLFFYSRILIWNGIAGNFVTAYLSASICFFGASAGGASSIFLIPSLFVFLVVMLREIIFDLQDQKGDAAVGMMTVATLYGSSCVMRVSWALLCALTVLGCWYGMTRSIFTLVLIIASLLLIFLGLWEIRRYGIEKGYTRFVSLSRWALLALVPAFVLASPRFSWAAASSSFPLGEYLAPGFAGYIVVGLAIAFYYISNQLLNEFHTMSRESFDQMDPRWRFYSVYGGLMIVIMVQLFTYAWHASMVKSGFFQAFVQHPHWLRHLALAAGFIPLPVLWLELLYSQHWSHIGFTPYYESNLGNVPFVRALVKHHSEVRQGINKFPKTKNELIRYFYNTSVFVASWLFYYVVSPLSFIHLYKNWKRAEIDRTGKQLLQLCMDIFVIISLFAFYITLATSFILPNNELLQRLTYLPSWLALCVLFIAAFGTWLAKPYDYNIAQYGSNVHFLLGLYVPALYFDALGVSNAPNVIFGGWAPWVLTLFLLLLSSAFLRDLTEARRRTAGWLREGLTVNFADRVLHKVANLLQPPKASLHNAKEWLESKEKLETLIVKEDVRNLLLASIDNGLHSIDESFEVINKLKIAVRENKMPSWHPVSDLLKIVDVDYVFAHNIRIKPSITTGSPGLELQVDKELFGTVMQNLVENAVDALRNQGNRSPDIQIQVNDVGSSPHGCTIVVQDNGPGITKENQEKIYQPWFSTKSTGSGMGLFIVQQFMMETGGTLVHETNTAPEKPTFTRFKLHFPGSRVRIVG